MRLIPLVVPIQQVPRLSSTIDLILLSARPSLCPIMRYLVKRPLSARDGTVAKDSAKAVRISALNMVFSVCTKIGRFVQIRKNNMDKRPVLDEFPLFVDKFHIFQSAILPTFVSTGTITQPIIQLRHEEIPAGHPADDVLPDSRLFKHTGQ